MPCRHALQPSFEALLCLLWLHTVLRPRPRQLQRQLMHPAIAACPSPMPPCCSRFYSVNYSIHSNFKHFKLPMLQRHWQAAASRGAVCGRPGRPARCVAIRAAIVGVDLGTSNSAVSAIGGEEGCARVLRNAQGSASVPSVVAIAQVSLL